MACLSDVAHDDLRVFLLDSVCHLRCAHKRRLQALLMHLKLANIADLISDGADGDPFLNSLKSGSSRTRIARFSAQFLGNRRIGRVCGRTADRIPIHSCVRYHAAESDRAFLSNLAFHRLRRPCFRRVFAVYGTHLERDVVSIVNLTGYTLCILFFGAV